MREINLEKLGKGEQPAYSKEFEELISSEGRLRQLIEGSHVSITPWNPDVAWKDWEQGRRFISEAIYKDGSILDYGCANGFLLRCLKEWSSHQLDAYGYDHDLPAIQEARKLFPPLQDHFATEGELQTLPPSFDFIYWNVWDNYQFVPSEMDDFVPSLLNARRPGGRLIMGFYDQTVETINRLPEYGYTPSGSLINPSREDECIVWFDRPVDDEAAQS